MLITLSKHTNKGTETASTRTLVMAFVLAVAVGARFGWGGKPPDRATCVASATQPSTDPAWQLAITGGDSKDVIQWDVSSDPPKQSFKYKNPHGNKVSFLSVALDANRLFSSSFDHEVRVYELGKPGQNPLVTFNGHAANTQVWAVAGASDGLHAVSSTNSGEIIYWDATPGNVVNRVLATVPASQDPVGGLVFLPGNNQFLACQGYGEMTLYDVVSNGAVPPQYQIKVNGTAFVTGNRQPINSVAVTKMGTTAVTGGLDMTVRIWEVGSRRNTFTIPHGDIVWRVAISPDESMCASACEDGSVQLFNLNTGNPCVDATGRPVRVGEGPGHGVMGVAFINDEKIVYTAGDYNNLEIKTWDIRAFHP